VAVAKSTRSAAWGNEPLDFSLAESAEITEKKLFRTSETLA